MNDFEQPVDDPALDAFLADAVFGIDQELDEDMAAPDLAAVVSLAYEMDPQAVPAGWVEEAAQFAPVISLREGRSFRHTQNDPAMAAIVAQVRAAMDHEVGVELAQRQHGAAGVPAVAEAGHTEVVVPMSKPAASHRGWYVGLAAAALLLIGGAGLISAQLMQRQQADRVPDTALSERLSDNDVRQAEIREADRASRTADSAAGAEPEVELDEVEPEPEPEVAPQVEPEPTRKRSLEPIETRVEKLTRLDREAQEAWKAGDIATARSKFEKIVNIGGKHRLADLAYGDLFTLARNSGNASREAKLWKTYLRRFPKGRFADDARAGLCRRASGATRGKCWDRYLRDMPKGAYRSEADQETKALQ